MKTLEVILGNLNKLTFVENKGKDTLLTEEGFEVSLYTKFQHSKFNSLKLPSVQVVLAVKYKGVPIKQWGCGGDEDTKMVVDFFLEKDNLVNVHKGLLEDNTQAEGKDIFNSLEFK